MMRSPSFFASLPPRLRVFIYLHSHAHHTCRAIYAVCPSSPRFLSPPIHLLLFLAGGEEAIILRVCARPPISIPSRESPSIHSAEYSHNAARERMQRYLISPFWPPDTILRTGRGAGGDPSTVYSAVGGIQLKLPVVYSTVLAT